MLYYGTLHCFSGLKQPVQCSQQPSPAQRQIMAGAEQQQGKWILGIFSYIDKHSPSRPFYPLVAPRILFQFLTFRFVFCIFGWGKSIETSLPRSRPATPRLPHLAQISTGEVRPTNGFIFWYFSLFTLRFMSANYYFYRLSTGELRPINVAFTVVDAESQM